MARRAKGTDPDKDVPTLTIWLPQPEMATGAAVVVCPGGGYGMLAVDHEGKQVAEWLNSLGIAAFVLKYRLGPRYHHPAMLHDAGRAIRTVRAGAARWGLDPHRIAIMGFSAGGHLASTAGTHFDAGKPDAERPDRARQLAAGPVDPGLSGDRAGDARTDMPGSLRNLLGDNPTQELVENLSNERQVTKETPPTFLAHTNADKRCPGGEQPPVRPGLAQGRRAGRAASLRARAARPGPGRRHCRSFKIAPEPSFQAWPKLCETWLKNQGFLDKKTAGN